MPGSGTGIEWDLIPGDGSRFMSVAPRNACRVILPDRASGRTGQVQLHSWAGRRWSGRTLFFRSRAVIVHHRLASYNLLPTVLLISRPTHGGQHAAQW